MIAGGMRKSGPQASPAPPVPPAPPARPEPPEPARSRAPLTAGDLDALAHTAAELVGNCAVLWRAGEGGALEPIAARHRDHGLAASIAALLPQLGPLMPADGWPGQTLQRQVPFRLESGGLADLGLETEVSFLCMPDRLRAMFVPVFHDGPAAGVLAVLRGLKTPAYTLREQTELVRIAARVAGREAIPPAAGLGDVQPELADALIEDVDFGVWVVDGAGRTTFVNTAMTTMLGVPASTLLGRSMRHVLGEEPTVVSGSFCVESETADRLVPAAEGERERWIATTSKSLVDADGAHCGTLTTAFDVTERKRRELEARERAGRIRPA